MSIAAIKTTIWDFWKSNQKFWFPITTEEKSIADKTIFQTFYNYADFFDENPVGKIIYLDQFFRHFQRVLPDGTVSEKDIYQNRQKAAEILSASWSSLRLQEDPLVIVWSLMPLKHLGRFQELFAHLQEVDCSHGPLSKFYQDSYKKAYTEAEVSSKIISDHSNIISSAKYSDETLKEICESYPEGRHGLPDASEGSLELVRTLMESLYELDKKYITVSLSGGVDSMVMVTLLKNMGFNVHAVHIVYGNREESEKEYALIAKFCTQLNIPLKVYKIEWLRRDNSEREFYEQMTREIRFMVYRAVANEGPILLGHIKEDIIENIWTNIANAQHLHNLKKMDFMEEQLGIKLCRPFLDQDKETIYEVAKTFSIPFLKNTTPSWSNRGKFREKFHQAAIDQYGPEVDKKIIQFAEAITQQSRILDRIIYQPIYRSYNADTKTIDMTTALDAELDTVGYIAIFEYICHRILSINKPSMKCISVFAERMMKIYSNSIREFTMDMNKHLHVKVRAIKPLYDRCIMELIML